MKMKVKVPTSSRVDLWKGTVADENINLECNRSFDTRASINLATSTRAAKNNKQKQNVFVDVF